MKQIVCAGFLFVGGSIMLSAEKIDATGSLIRLSEIAYLCIGIAILLGAYGLIKKDKSKNY